MQEKLKIIYEVCLLSENPKIQTFVQPLKNRKYSFTENLNRKILRKQNISDSFLFVSTTDVIQIFNENGILKTVKCHTCDHIYGFTVLNIENNSCCLLVSTNRYQYSLYNINVLKSKKIQKGKIRNEILHIRNENYSSDEYKEEKRSECGDRKYFKTDSVYQDEESFISKVRMKAMNRDSIHGNHYPYLPFCESLIYFPYAENKFLNHLESSPEKRIKNMPGESREHSYVKEDSLGRPIRILGYHRDFGFQLLESFENYDRKFNLISTEQTLDREFPEVLVPFKCSSFGHFDNIDISKCKKVLAVRGTSKFFIMCVLCVCCVVCVVWCVLSVVCCVLC